MKEKKRIKNIWMLLIGIIALIMLSPTAVFADAISDAMQKVINVYPNSCSYFTSDGKSDSNSGDPRCSLVNIPSRGGLPSGRTVRDARGGDAHSCHAFAEYVWYVMFGHCTNTQTRKISASELRVGDFIRFSGHSAIYLGEDASNYYVYDSNWATPADNKVRYNHKISKSRGIEACYRATNSPESTPGQSNHDPYGCLDSCSGGAGVVNISGWAKDDDAPDQGVELHVYIGGPVGSAEGEGHGGIYANKHRSDVGNHAYSETIKTNKTGRQEIYIYGINIGGGTNPLIATGTVNIDPAYHNPVGFLDSCSGGKGVVNISGWTKDDDAPDAGLDIHVYIGGSAGSGVSPQGFRADKYRSDVGKHAFWETIKTNKTGVQEVYVYAINVGGGGNTLIGKGTVNIDPAEIRGSEMSSGYNRVLPDGDYLIASASKPQYYLDIQGSAVPAANNTNVALCGPLSGEPPVHDIWTITYTNGFYRISQKGAGVSLDVYGADTLQGQNVQVYGNSGSSAQKWAISRNNRNGYQIQAKCSGYALDIANGTIANGTNVHQHPVNASAAQEWSFIPYKPSQDMQNGRYIILTDLDRTVEVDVPGDTGDVPNEANIQLWKDTALSRYNSFDITKLSNGYYKIIHAASGKALDLYGGGTALGSNISLHDANGSTAQQWAITNAGGDSFIVWARCSGMVMDVDHAKTANGTNIAQHTYSGSSNQKWHFVKAEYPVTYDLMGGQGNPEKQIKYYKSALKLSAAVPRKTGYIFKGWSDSKNQGGSVYAPGSTYTKDADLRLYAVWEKDPVPVLSVSQKAGTLTAAVSNMDYVKEYGFVYAKGSNVTLESPGRTRTAYSKVDSSGRYSFDATELTGCTIRAYAAYTDEDGTTQVIYSDPISR